MSVQLQRSSAYFSAAVCQRPQVAAEAVFRDCLRLQRASLGNAHPYTLGSAASLGSVLQARGGHEGEAEPLLRETLRLRVEHIGPEHPDTASRYRTGAQKQSRQTTVSSTARQPHSYCEHIRAAHTQQAVF